MAANKIRFTFLVTEKQKEDLLVVAECLRRTPSDAIRILIEEKKREIELEKKTAIVSVRSTN